MYPCTLAITQPQMFNKNNKISYNKNNKKLSANHTILFIDRGNLYHGENCFLANNATFNIK